MKIKDYIHDLLGQRLAKAECVVLYELFKGGGAPSFSTVDALDGGSTWPQLRTILSVESPKEIVVGLLCPTEAQKASMEGDKNWLNEYRQFAEQTLGLQPHSKTSA